MNTLYKKEPFLLLLGDLGVFVFSLWLALTLRNGAMPDQETFLENFFPFTIVFVFWVITFFVAGLYDLHTTALRYRLPNIIVGAQIANSLIAVVFFYLIPSLGITPKTILVLEILISLAAIIIWRIYGERLFGRSFREPAILIGAKEEAKLLMAEVNENSHHYLKFVSFIDLEEVPEAHFREAFVREREKCGATTIALDLRNEKLAPIISDLYALMFTNVRFVSVQHLYEEAFARLPLGILDQSWIIEHISLAPRFGYDTLKRLMDIAIALLLLICALPLLPLVFLAIKLEDGGPVFIVQERIGKNMRTIRIVKVRSMKTSDRGKWITENDERHTKVGKWLRKTRIDELPQLWNVLRGDLSLIGPRPDIYDLGKQLADMIFYYNIRSLITPGLSGWAQVNQEKPPQSVEETRRRLEYDLYYIKHRSFLLDLKIALRTLKTLLMRAGV